MFFFKKRAPTCGMKKPAATERLPTRSPTVVLRAPLQRLTSELDVGFVFLGSDACFFFSTRDIMGDVVRKE